MRHVPKESWHCCVNTSWDAFSHSLVGFNLHPSCAKKRSEAQHTCRLTPGTRRCSGSRCNLECLGLPLWVPVGFLILQAFQLPEWSSGEKLPREKLYFVSQFLEISVHNQLVQLHLGLWFRVHGTATCSPQGQNRKKKEETWVPQFPQRLTSHQHQRSVFWLSRDPWRDYISHTGSVQTTHKNRSLGWNLQPPAQDRKSDDSL